MASSARSRPSNTANRQTKGLTPLPTYQPPQGPLNEAAQRALQNLSREHKLESLKTRLRAANNHLTHAAADVNERLQIKNVQYEKQKRRQGPQEEDEQDTIMETARHRTEEMTGRLEGSVRMIIDSSAEVDNVDRALKELQENIVEGRGRILPTQSTLGASQFRQGRARRDQGADLDDEEHEGDVENDSPMDVLKRKIADKHSEYEALSMALRYHR